MFFLWTDRGICYRYAIVYGLLYKSFSLFSHQSLQRKPVTRWLAEMDGVRQMMTKFASVSDQEVVGMRAPQLSSGGDAMFEVKKFHIVLQQHIVYSVGKPSESFSKKILVTVYV